MHAYMYIVCVCMHVYMCACMCTCVHVCMHVYMYTCMFVIFVCICKSFIQHTSVIKLFPWQHIRIHSGHFVHIVFISIFLLIMEPWVIDPRKVHAIKSKILRVDENCGHFLLLSSKLLRFENKQFLKRIIVWIYKHQRKCALKTRSLFIEKIMNKPSGTVISKWVE